MRIKQCYMSDGDKLHYSDFIKRHNFKNYNKRKLPVIFFSGWTMYPIRNHKSLGIIVWRGSDATDKRLKSLVKKRNIYHIAISSFIAKDLERFGLKYKFIPLISYDMDMFKPKTLGDEIYTYIPYNNKKYNNRYGWEIVKKVKQKCKYKINIIQLYKKYNRHQIKKIYKRCFCGFRFTKHDGLPNQVIEMGLMGRRSFYNGNIPCSIKWHKKNIDKIIDDIENEAHNIGTINYNVSNDIKQFITVKDNWLDTDFWTK